MTDNSRVLVIETIGGTTQVTEGRTLVQEDLILPDEVVEGAMQLTVMDPLLKVTSRTHPGTGSRGSSQ